MSILKSASIVSAMTLISRMLGLIRDHVLARYFPPGPEMDAFLVAFKIPNFMRRLFAEGSFAQAFVPVLSEYRTQKSPLEAKDLVDRAAGTLALILFLVVIVGEVTSPWVALAFGTERELTSELIRSTFPYILFISLVSFASSVLNAYGKFAAPAFSPVYLNLVLIITALWVAPHFAQPIYTLGWAVFAAGVVQLLFLLPALYRLGMVPCLRPDLKHPGVRKILKLMMPAVFGSSVAQVNLLFDSVIASFLAAGSVSWLYFSDRLLEFPLGIFGVALGTVILPSLSKIHAAQDPEKFSHMLDWGMRWVVLVSFPAMVGLLLLAGPLVVSVFQYDRFSSHDVEMSRLALVALATGLPAFILIKVLAPGYFARQDTKTPVKIGITAMIVNMGFNVLIVTPMVLLDFSAPHIGLSIATAASAYLNAGMLFRILRRDKIFVPMPGWWRFMLNCLVALLAMATALYFYVPDLNDWIQAKFWVRATWLALSVLGGACVYFAVLLLMGVRRRDLLTPNF